MLRGQSAVVTGSTSGIGLGIAQALARAGVNVVLNGFGDAKQIESLRRSLSEEAGVRAEYSSADVSRPDQIAWHGIHTTGQMPSIDLLDV